MIFVMADVSILHPEMVLSNPDPADLRVGAAVAIEDDRIAAIDDPETLRARWPAVRPDALPGCMVLPGLVNAHQHGRGISQIQLGFHDDFLELWINRRRGRGVLNAYPITKLAAANMLANGITCTIHANYSYGSGDYESEVRDSLRAYDETGIRATLSVGAMDQGMTVYPPHEACFMAGLPGDIKDWLSRPGPPAYAGDGAATVALMARLRHDYEGHPRIRLCYGPAGPQWVSDALWKCLAEDAEREGLGLHLHALESPAQVAACAALYPQGVFSYLENLGAMTPRTVIAHGVWVNDADMEVIARTDATVVRNPGCNLRLRNGIAPLARYLERGVRVALGTDNAALADDEDLLKELRLAALLAREPDWNGRVPPTTGDLLAAVTVNGAVAAQIAPDVGTLEPGKKADLIAISLERVRRPYLDPDMPVIDATLARATGADVRLTMVDGRVVYRDGRHTLLDIEEVERQARESALAASRPKEPANADRMMTLHRHMMEHYQETASRDRDDDNRKQRT